MQVTPVNRNLETRATLMLLEFEDLLVVLGSAAIMNVVGHFRGRRDRPSPHQSRPALRGSTSGGANIDGLPIRQAAACVISSSGTQSGARIVHWLAIANSGAPSEKGIKCR